MATKIEAIVKAAPGHQAMPRAKAAFVRRKGDYGFGWPGAIYDGMKGFHQIFFYGNHERQLRAYCQMFGIQAQSPSN